MMIFHSYVFRGVHYGNSMEYHTWWFENNINIDVPLVIPHSKKNPRSRFFFLQERCPLPMAGKSLPAGPTWWNEWRFVVQNLWWYKTCVSFKKRIENEILCNSIWIYVYKIYLIIKICICTNETHIHVCTHLSIPLRLKTTACCWCLPPRQPVSCLQVPTSFFLFPRKPAMPSNVPFLP